MQVGYRASIKPKDIQKATLRQWLGCCDFVWNSKIEENAYLSTYCRKYVPVTKYQWFKDKNGKWIEPEFQWINQSYSQFKSEELTPFLSEVPSTLLRNSTTKWFKTQNKFMKGECGAPRKKKAGEGRSALFTNDTFEITSHTKTSITIVLGTKTNNVGTIEVRLREPIPSNPNSITIRFDQYDRWFCSFSYDDGIGEDKDIDQYTKEKYAEVVASRSEAELKANVLGIDRGIRNPVATDKAMYGFTKEQKKSLTKSEKKKKFLMRQMARQKLGSKRKLRSRRRLSRMFEKQSNIRKDQNHKASFAIVNRNDKDIFVLEDLSLKNMTKSASGTIENPGKNVRQKAGLNRELLNTALYQFETYLKYKAQRKNKLVLKVPAHFTSQECSHCGNIHPANRHEENFVCVVCGHAEDADKNASKSIGNKAIRFILHSGTELASGGVLRNKKLQAGPSKMKVLEGNSRPKGEQPGKRDAVAKQPPKLVPFRGE